METDFLEVRKPSFINHRSMRHYQHMLITTSLDQFQSRDRFTKTHLGIPEHSVLLFETGLSLGNRLFLLGSENYFHSII